jgi:hypothetical protein
MADKTHSTPFHVIQGGAEGIAREDLPFELPVSLQEYKGLRVVRRPGAPPLYEVDHDVFSTLSESQMTPVHALVWLDLQGETASREPGDAARLVLQRLQARGRLTPGRRRILENMPEHAHEMTQSQASNFYGMAGWLERWWPGLKSYA